MTVLGIVLATYNEAENLPHLITSLETLLSPQDIRIYVVDDNSPDGTSRVAEGLGRRYGNIYVINRPAKLGLGSALRDGMRAALAGDCSYVLTIDADLSHNPKDVPKLLVVAESGDADLVQASRYVEGGGSARLAWHRRLQGYTANLLCRWLLGTPREATTNFRVHTKRSADLAVNESRGRDLEFQPECILIAMRHGLRIVEVPIIFSARAEGRSKVGIQQHVRWLLFFLKAVITFRLRIGRYSRVESRYTSSGRKEGG